MIRALLTAVLPAIIFFNACSVPPNPVTAAIEEGNAARARGDLAAAEGAFEKAVNLDARSYEGRMNLAAVRLELGRYDAAVEAFTKIIESYPPTADVYVNRGEAYSRQSKFKEALADFGRAAILSPKNPTVFFNRGIARDNSGDSAGAVEDYNTAESLATPETMNARDMASLYCNRGNSFRQLGKLDRAFAEYERSLAKDPTLPNTYWGRSLTWEKRGDFENAIADVLTYVQVQGGASCLKAGDEKRATQHEVLNCLALIRHGEGSLTSALSIFGRLIKENTKVAQVWFNRGNVLQAQGKSKEAIYDFGQYIQRQPADEWGYVNRGNAYLMMGKHDAAIADFNVALVRVPKSSNVFNSRGYAYMQAKKYDQAQRDFEKALEIDPGAEITKVNLARLKGLMGE